MTPHPQRCETCDRDGQLECPMPTFETDSEEYPGLKREDLNLCQFVIKNYINKIGCASHSSAPSEQEIRGKVLDQILNHILDDMGVEIHERNGEKYFVISGVFSVSELILYLQELRSKQGEP